MVGLKVAFRVTFLLFFLLFGNLVFITRSFLHYSRHTFTVSCRDRSFKFLNHISYLTSESRPLQTSRRNIWSQALFGRKKKSSEENESTPAEDESASSASSVDPNSSIEAEPSVSEARKRGRRPKKPPNIYTQPDSVTFTRDTMNSKIISATDGQRKKITKQELLAEMNDLDEVMGKMEDILPLTRSSSGKKSSKESKEAKSGSKSSTGRGGGGSIDVDRESNGQKNDLDEIEEGFLKFLENNDVDVEFQRIQESLENFNEDELDPTLLPPSEEEEGVVDEIDFDLLQRDIRSKKKPGGVKGKITPFINVEESIDNVGLKKSKNTKKMTSLLPGEDSREREMDSVVNPSSSPITKRKVGRKRKDEEEEFDISSYLNKEFYGNQLSTPSILSSSSTSSPSSTPMKEEDIAEDDEDLFFNEALQAGEAYNNNNSNNNNMKKINMKEELSKMEKVLRNFDHEFPSSNLDQYSLPMNPSFNVPQSLSNNNKKNNDDDNDDNDDDEDDSFDIDVNEDDENDAEKSFDIESGEVDEKRGRGGGGRGRGTKRSRSAYKGLNVEGDHNITAEEMKEVLSSFDEEDDDDDDEEEEEEDEAVLEDEGEDSESLSPTNKTTKKSSGSSLISPTGSEYEFDFESLFQRMNYTENLEKQFLTERAKKKENEIEKIRKKLAELTRMTTSTGRSKGLGPRDKNKAIKELQFQLLSLEDELESIESLRDSSSSGSRKRKRDQDGDSEDEEGEGDEEEDGEEEDEDEDEDSSSKSIWDDDGGIISAEEYDILHNPTGRERRRRSQKRTLRNYYQDLVKGEEVTVGSEGEDDSDDSFLSDSDTSSSPSTTTTTTSTSTPNEMTEEQYVRLDLHFDENEVRREKLRLTQTSLVQMKKPGSDEIVEVNVTTPMVIDARYPDWKLDLRDYINNVNVTKIIEEGPNWDLLPSPNETELLNYAQQIYRRLSYEQDLFYDSSYAYIPLSMREERNEEGEIVPKTPNHPYPQEPHDVHLQLAEDEPMHSRLVVTTVLSFMNTTEELKRGIAVIKKLYELFDQATHSDDRVEYQLWIYCEDFIRSPYIIAEPLFRRYDYNLTRYLSDLSPEEHLFTLALKEEEAMQAKLEEQRKEKRATKAKKKEEVEEQREQTGGEGVGREEEGSGEGGGGRSGEGGGRPVSGRAAAPGVVVYHADTEELINYYYLMSESYQKNLKQLVDNTTLQSEELWRSSLEGVMQMWCEGYNTYHLVNGKLMKDIWGGINPDVLFAPKNLAKLTSRVKEALAEDSYNAVYLPPRMEEDWRFGDMLYPPEDLTEIDYGLDE